MKPRLTPAQGQIVRAVALYLSKEGKHSVTTGAVDTFVVESVESWPWASLTFAGERHRVVACVAAGLAVENPIRAEGLVVPRRIVAIEGEAWTAVPGGAVLTLDLLAICHDDELLSWA